MKRSEVIKLIESLFEIAPNHDNNANAENLLCHLEELGMLPPGYMKPIPFESDGKQYPLIPGDFRNNDNIWCTPGVNEWEKE